MQFGQVKLHTTSHEKTSLQEWNFFNTDMSFNDFVSDSSPKNQDTGKQQKEPYKYQLYFPQMHQSIVCDNWNCNFPNNDKTLQPSCS